MSVRGLLSEEEINLEQMYFDTAGIWNFSYTYYGEDVELYYNPEKHQIKALSGALTSYWPVCSNAVYDNFDTKFIENILREEAGLLYNARSYSRRGIGDEEWGGFVEIYLEPGTGLEIRDIYDNTIIELLDTID